MGVTGIPVGSGVCVFPSQLLTDVCSDTNRLSRPSHWLPGREARQLRCLLKLHIPWFLSADPDSQVEEGLVICVTCAQGTLGPVKVRSSWVRS